MSRFSLIKARNKDAFEWAPLASTKSAPSTGSKGVHWLNPLLLNVCFLAGLLLALAHHLVYSHYNGRVLSTEQDSESQQKLVIRIGTGLAFLVKAMLTVAVSIVFAQQFWVSLGRTAESVDNIDAMSCIRSNILQFFRIRLWLRQWMLLILALIMWCLPIASVITPGTIHVEPSVTYNRSSTLKVPQPQQIWRGSQKFESGFLNTSIGGGPLNFVHGPPSGPLWSTALGSLTSSSILPIAPDFRNTSYNLSFYAPAYKCAVADLSSFQTFNTSLYRDTRRSGFIDFDNLLRSYSVKYNGWVNSSMYSLDRPNWYNGSDSYDTSSSYLTDNSNTYYYYFSNNNRYANTSSLIQCGLYNASYTVNLRFGLGDQAVNVTSKQIREAVPSTNFFIFNGTAIPSAGFWNLVFTYNTLDYGNIVYNAVLNAFNNVVMGNVANATVLRAANLRTSFQGLNYTGGIPAATALRSYFEEPVNKLVNPARLITTLENMFENVTLSIMANSDLRDPSPIEVPVETWQSVLVFAYSPRDLFIAYGYATFATLICLLWGMYLMYYHVGASFDTGFSTILRTTYGDDFDWIMRTEYRAGECPVPSKLGEVKLRYRGRRRKNDDGSGDQGFSVVD